MFYREADENEKKNPNPLVGRDPEIDKITASDIKDTFTNFSEQNPIKIGRSIIDIEAQFHYLQHEINILHEEIDHLRREKSNAVRHLKNEIGELKKQIIELNKSKNSKKNTETNYKHVTPPKKGKE